MNDVESVYQRSLQRQGVPDQLLNPPMACADLPFLVLLIKYK